MGLIGLLLSSLFRSVVLVGGWMGGGEGGVDFEENELEWRWLSVYLSIYIYIYIFLYYNFGLDWSIEVYCGG